MTKNLNLNWLRSFETAARLLSFTRASHELGLTQTAISQHIKALEQKLGQRLFIRRPKSLLLTDIGKAYLTSVRDALNTIELSTSGLFGPNLESTVTVRASMAFVVWLSPKLGPFLDQHPGVGVKLVTSIWDSSTGDQPIDIDIILAPQKHAKPHLEKLSYENIVPICGVGMAKTISAPVDLLQHSPIHILGFDDHLARYLSAFDLSPEPSATRLMADTSVAATELVAANLGYAIVIERFAQQSVAVGHAIGITGKSVSLGQSHYLSRRDNQGKSQPAVDAFATWLKRCLAG